MAGRAWRIESVDWDRFELLVSEQRERGKVLWPGEPIAESFEMCRAQREVLLGADPQVTLGLAGQVEVPSLLGRRVDEAREDLEDIGLVLMTDDHDDDDRILTQSPRARSAVPAGSEVEVRAL